MHPLFRTERFRPTASPIWRSNFKKNVSVWRRLKLFRVDLEFAAGIHKQQMFPLFFALSRRNSFSRGCIFASGGLKVRKAAWVFFIVTGNDEHGLVELVVAKLLKGDGGCDCGENRDVCRENRKLVFTFTPAWIDVGWFSYLTEFDRKTWRELHLNKLPEFIKVLEGCNHLQNIQQPETKHVVTDEKGCTEPHHAEGRTHDSMPRGKSWLMAIVALKFFLLSLQTSSLPRWGGLRRCKQPIRSQDQCATLVCMPKSFLSVVWHSRGYVHIHHRKQAWIRTFRCQLRRIPPRNGCLVMVGLETASSPAEEEKETADCSTV